MVEPSCDVKRPRPEGTWAVILCAASAALALGCGDDVIGEVAPSPLNGCAPITAADAWANQTFSEQAGRFHAEFDATPSASSIDAVIGLGDGGASAFTDLAAIVRFNPAGMIDARDGAGYRADAVRRYEAGKRYHVRIDVDVGARIYTVWLRNDLGGYDAIARGYSFRSERSGVSRLNNVASKVDAPGGDVEVCGFFVIADGTTGDRCAVASAGDGFVTVPLPDATVLDTVTFSATPSAPNIDAVIGLAGGPVTRFSDLAAAVRFAPSGVIDVRDGDIYRADLARTYRAESADVRVIADVTSHTYSVFEGVWFDARELARQVRFRTQQSGVSHLDRLALIVDGDQGSVTVCLPRGVPSTGVAYSKEGTYRVLPLAGDEALIGDGATTTRVDAAGRAVAQVARAGELTTDALGNVFIASISGTALTVDKYSPGFAPVWSASWPVHEGSVAVAASTDASGAVLVAATSPLDGGLVSVTRFSAGGTFSSQLATGGNAVTLDGDEPIVAWNHGDTLRISRLHATGATVWSVAFAGQAFVSTMAVDPDHNLVFGGELFTPMDFGGGTLPLQQTDDGKLNAFVVKLSQAGAHVFSRKTGYTHIGGIAASTARIVVSGTRQTQFHTWRLHALDPSGAPIAGPAGNTGFGENGFGRRVAIGPSGRVWWNLETQWPLFPRWPYLVVLNP